MNAVEIEAAVSDLASAPYDAAEFPFQFLAAFDKKETALKRLRKGDTNRTDVAAAPGCTIVLLTNSIHLATCPAGQIRETLDRLKASPKTASARAKFIFATDGDFFEAEEVSAASEHIADGLPNLANHFGFFLPLAGISTVKEIKDSAIDVRATGRLNKLYVELLRTNPEWGTAARRHDMNHFMARLIFCFFAEHTDIFNGSRLFTDTIEQMSEADGSNTHMVLGEIFRAMNVKPGKRLAEGLRPFADQFPYVNGGLFADSTETPVFNRIARSYLLQAGKLEWQHINPDIFGSMIQAVADDEERGALGMHYTSVPNILKVLNPLFLDDLRAQLEAAGENGRMLLNLRQRMSRIRVFDPACGSGNFLVIAYKQMRSIEAKINKLRGEEMRPADISEKNFRGIELRDFAAEIARLALVIAKYQCDVQHRGPLAAKAEFLPLKDDNWITCGNALRLSWLQVCPPTGAGVKLNSDDLFQTPLDQPAIDFENTGGETYICGNPPYLGKGKKKVEQLEDMRLLFSERTEKFGYIDFVGCWLVLAAEYCRATASSAALVATNSVCQGRQLPQLWPLIFKNQIEISFARHSFKWSNNAARNAGVICVIIGLSKSGKYPQKLLFTDEFTKAATHINAYLLDFPDILVESRPNTLASFLPKMLTGSVPNDDGNLILTQHEIAELRTETPEVGCLVRPFLGSQDYLRGAPRSCLWISDNDLELANTSPNIVRRLERVRLIREVSDKKETREILSKVPHRFQHRARTGRESTIIIPSVSSENRDWFPAGFLPAGSVISNLAFMLIDAPLWSVSLVVSRIHLVWIATVCGKLKSDYRYSNTLGWNTFPVPALTDLNKDDLTRCAEDILLAREAHFPKTIADLYDPEEMPDNLRAAHEANDETLERIYIGRRFRNDTERLEKLFEMYTKMTGAESNSRSPSGMTTRYTKQKATA